MASRALESALDELHAQVAKVLTEGLTGEGEKSPSPQFIAQAIKFLKDNGVDAPAKSERISNLIDTLGAVNLDEVAAIGGRPN